LRAVQPTDLLGRRRVELDVSALRAELNGARVAITGPPGPSARSSRVRLPGCNRR